jgi:hypothetical protein
LFGKNVEEYFDKKAEETDRDKNAEELRPQIMLRGSRVRHSGQQSCWQKDNAEAIARGLFGTCKGSLHPRRRTMLTVGGWSRGFCSLGIS